MDEPGFSSSTSFYLYHPFRIRCPSTLFLTIRITTKSIWPAGLKLLLFLGHGGLQSSSKKFPAIDGANQSHERKYKAHFWYDPDTDFTRFRYFVWEAGAWVEDIWGGAKPYDPTRVEAVMDLKNIEGSGFPEAVGFHMENLKLLRGLH